MCSIDISDEKRVNFVFYWDSIEVEKKTNQHPTINPLFFFIEPQQFKSNFTEIRVQVKL